MSFSDLAEKYDLKKEYILFLKYVKLYLSIPEKWKNNIPSFHLQRSPPQLLRDSQRKLR